MPGKIKLSEIPIHGSIDPSVAEALRQMITNTATIAAQVDSDVVTFASLAGQVKVAHRLGRRPLYWAVVDTNGAATIYVSAADRAAWTTTLVAFTTSGTGTTFKVEVR